MLTHECTRMCVPACRDRDHVSKEVVLVFASGVLRSFRNCCHILITACNIGDGHLTDATSFPAILLMRVGHYTVFHRHERCKSYTWKQVLVVWHILTNARELLQNLGRSSPHGKRSSACLAHTREHTQLLHYVILDTVSGLSQRVPCNLSKAF